MKKVTQMENFISSSQTRRCELEEDCLNKEKRTEELAVALVEERKQKILLLDNLGKLRDEEASRHAAAETYLKNECEEKVIAMKVMEVQLEQQSIRLIECQTNLELIENHIASVVTENAVLNEMIADLTF